MGESVGNSVEEGSRKEGEIGVQLGSLTTEQLSDPTILLMKALIEKQDATIRLLAQAQTDRMLDTITQSDWVSFATAEGEELQNWMMLQRKEKLNRMLEFQQEEMVRCLGDLVFVNEGEEALKKLCAKNLFQPRYQQRFIRQWCRRGLSQTINSYQSDWHHYDSKPEKFQ